MKRCCSECGYQLPEDLSEDMSIFTLREYDESCDYKINKDLNVFLCKKCYGKWVIYMPKIIFMEEFKTVVLQYAMMKRERDIFLEKLDRKEVEPVVIME